LPTFLSRKVGVFSKPLTNRAKSDIIIYNKNNKNLNFAEKANISFFD